MKELNFNEQYVSPEIKAFTVCFNQGILAASDPVNPGESEGGSEGGSY